MNLIKKLKMFGVYDKYLVWDIVNFKQSYKIPAEFLNPDTIYEKIRSLDEADQFLSRNLFEHLKGAVHSYQFEYWAWHSRSFYKPLFEFWNFSMQFDSLTGVPNSNFNKNLFSETVVKKIFNKFDLVEVYNKLPNKWYYDMVIQIQKFRQSIQGTQTILFFNDFWPNFNRLMDIEDISRSVDKLRKKLMYFTGIDKLRHKNHGQIKIFVKTAEIEVFPKRNFNRYTDRLLVKG